MTPPHLIPRWALEWIGSTAAISTTASFVPQLVRVWRRKCASDILLTMFLLFSFGLLCWMIYGVGIGSGPVAMANAITLVLSLTILALKLRYDRRNRADVSESSSDKIKA